MVLVPFGRGNKPRMAVVLAVGEGRKKPPPGLKSLMPPRRGCPLDAGPAGARALFERSHLLHLVRGRQGSHSVWRAVPARMENGKPVLKGRLTRSTGNGFTLWLVALPEKPKPGPRQILAAVAARKTCPLTARQLDEGIFPGQRWTALSKGILTAASRISPWICLLLSRLTRSRWNYPPEQQNVYDLLAGFAER